MYIHMYAVVLENTSVAHKQRLHCLVSIVSMPPNANTTLTHLTPPPPHHQRLACAARVDLFPSFAALANNLHVLSLPLRA